MSTASFDTFADDYNVHLNSALSITGESREYFGKARVRWLQRRLKLLSAEPRVLLDYGCGTGDTCPALQEAFNARSVIGIDTSARSVELARLQNSSEQYLFATIDNFQPDGSIDLTYCNGVFHHIPPAERGSATDLIFRCLRPGGWFSLWENNPFNPGTRFVMSRCAFDEDAILLTPGETCELVRKSGFEIVNIDHCFFFPRFLRLLRFLEPKLCHVPLGAQYQVLCRKPRLG